MTLELKPAEMDDVGDTLLSQLKRYLEMAVRLRVEGYDRETRRRLSACNIVAYMAAVSYFSFVITFSAYNASDLMNLVAANFLAGFIMMLTPFMHRISPLASAYVIAMTAIISLIYFMSQIGRDTGVYLHFIVSIALTFVVFGLENFRQLLFVVMICVVGHLVTYFLFPVGTLRPLLDDGFVAQLYIISAVTSMLLLALTIWYAFAIAADAEARSEKLLQNAFPSRIADQLREHPDEIIVDPFDEASVMFADIVGFTKLAREVSPQRLVELLNEIFSEFDKLGGQYGVEKIKTIGDSYMAVSGIPEVNADHAINVACLALEMQKTVEKLAKREKVSLDLRIGIATGSITAGVIGKVRFAYDVWSTTVNLASRLESHCDEGRIRVSQSTYQSLRNSYVFEKAPSERFKGIGLVSSWYLVAEKN